MTYSLPRIDTDGDDQVENANVDALLNLSASDSFSAYPLAIGTDTDHTAADHESGGSLALTLANLANQEATAILLDTAANRPAAGTADRLFFETDTGRVLYDNGTSWLEVGLSESQISLANLSSNAHSDLSTAPSSAHHAKYTDEEAQDAVGLNYDATLAYDDATPSFGVATGGVDTTQLAAQAVTPSEVDGSGGTAGQVLETDGTAAGVTWGTAPGTWNTSTITANTTASNRDEILADSSASALTVTLPTPSNGLRVRCKRIASSNGVTLARSGTENIDGSASDYSISYLQSLEVVSDGTDWWIV